MSDFMARGWASDAVGAVVWIMQAQVKTHLAPTHIALANVFVFTPHRRLFRGRFHKVIEMRATQTR